MNHPSSKLRIITHLPTLGLKHLSSCLVTYWYYTSLGKATRYAAEAEPAAESRETDRRTGDGEVSLEEGEPCLLLGAGVPWRDSDALAAMLTTQSELRRCESAEECRGRELDGDRGPEK